MEFLAPAKINLSLLVKGRRDDGYHEIESLIAPVSIFDTLDIALRDQPGIDFTCDDPALPADDTNLVVRAAKLFCAEVGREPRLRLALRTQIPHGAGLGGGSSDAATTLLALNALCDARLSMDALTALAAQLGSDVPVFLHRSIATVRGRGEAVTPCAFPHTLPLLLVKPPFAVPTPWAYGRWRDSREVPDVFYAPQPMPWGALVNDLERPVFEKHLFLAQLKMWLRAQPEVAGALLSGSGATVFAVLKQTDEAAGLGERLRGQFGENLWIRPCEVLSDQAPA